MIPECKPNMLLAALEVFCLLPINKNIRFYLVVINKIGTFGRFTSGPLTQAWVKAIVPVTQTHELLKNCNDFLHTAFCAKIPRSVTS